MILSLDLLCSLQPRTWEVEGKGQFFAVFLTPLNYEARQFDERQFEGTNLSASQFSEKIYNFDFPSRALKRQQKTFCYVTKTIAIV